MHDMLTSGCNSIVCLNSGLKAEYGAYFTVVKICLQFSLKSFNANIITYTSMNTDITGKIKTDNVYNYL